MQEVKHHFSHIANPLVQSSNSSIVRSCYWTCIFPFKSRVSLPCQLSGDVLSIFVIVCTVGSRGSCSEHNPVSKFRLTGRFCRITYSKAGHSETKHVFSFGNYCIFGTIFKRMGVVSARGPVQDTGIPGPTLLNATALKRTDQQQAHETLAVQHDCVDPSPSLWLWIMGMKSVSFSFQEYNSFAASLSTNNEFTLDHPYPGSDRTKLTNG